MLPSLAAALADELRELEEKDRLRRCPPLGGATRVAPELDGRPVLSFCSNDYLGLASHPALAAAAAASASRTGLGAGASRLVAGEHPEHRALEAALASLVALPSALLFPTGYQANLGLLGALAGRQDLIVSDAANHASLIDGCRLSRAEVQVYAHRDVRAADALLAAAGRRHRRRLLLTESLFSMDGDVAPLAALAEIAARHEAVLVVDEAHALGVLGPDGRGLCRAAGVVPDALVGTLGKALGVSGGFVAGAPELRALLVNRARTFVFTTAPPPPLAAAAEVAVSLVLGPEGHARRAALHENVRRLREALSLPVADPAPIIPVVLGPDRAALEAARALLAAGIFVQPIRPPTVPEGTARLRITLSAAHAALDLDRLVQALRPILP